MATGKKLIIGNWKMNLNVHDASTYLHKLDVAIQGHRDVEVVVAPTMLALQPLSLQVNRHRMKLAAQNFYHRDFGAFTGEVSATQLRGLVSYALVGHSERRHVFHESTKDTREKVQAALRNHITPVLCIGETQAERANGETRDVLHDQLVGGLANITSEDVDHIVVAYEPVWAIGTGNNASPHDVEEAVLAIRSQVRHLFGKEKAMNLRILYGGSVTADSASDYLAIRGIDGLLVGGASLKHLEFATIIKKAHGLAA